MKTDFFAGWPVEISNHFYRITPSLENWTSSRKQCQKYGGELAFQGIRGSIENLK